jgi:hypothetical protein
MEGWNFSPRHLLVFGLCVWSGAVLCLLLGVFMRNICTSETPVQVKMDAIHISPEIKVTPAKQEPPVVNVSATAPVVNLPQGPAPVVNINVEREQPKPEAPKVEAKPEAPKAAEKKAEAKPEPKPERVASAPEQRPVMPPVDKPLTEEEKTAREEGKLLPPPRKTQ